MSAARRLSRIPEPCLGSPAILAAMPTDAPRSDVDRLRSDPAAWDEFVRTAPGGGYLQLSGWAAVKAANGWRAHRVVVDAGNGPIGVQVLVRRLGPTPFGVGYAPRGPVGPNDPRSIGALTGVLARLGRQQRLSHITMDPGWGVDVTDALPSPVTGLLAAGWRRSDDLQHDRTRVVDLEDTDRLWAGVRSRTQRYIKSARKVGITVTREGSGSMDEFHGLLVATAERAGFIYRDAESYRRIVDTFGSDGAHVLMARTAAGRAVAGLLIVRCGDTVAEPSGGMNDEGAATRANYLLKWEAISRAAADGARRYDMWGIAHGGIDQFKAGFGGHEVRYPGTFDLQTMPILRPGLLAARRAWVSLARRRRGLDGKRAHEGQQAHADTSGATKGATNE
jgi:peptidoglycan pentaglycine glycine transferase (the first glycine)